MFSGENKTKQNKTINDPSNPSLCRTLSKFILRMRTSFALIQKGQCFRLREAKISEIGTNMRSLGQICGNIKTTNVFSD